jgi:hypothetical protein
MSHASRLLLAVLISLAATLTIVPSSSADRVVRRDARHDLAFVLDESPSRPAPAYSDPDVVRTVVAHRHHRVIMRFRFARLDRLHAEYDVAGVIETPARFGYRFDVEWRRFEPVIVSLTHLSAHGGTSVDCPRLRPLLDLKRDLIRIRIPRKCLGSPRWVRLAMYVARGTSPGFLIDDPMSNRPVLFPPAPRPTRRLYSG